MGYESFNLEPWSLKESLTSWKCPIGFKLFQVSVDTWIPSWIPQDVFWQLFGFLSNPEGDKGIYYMVAFGLWLQCIALTYPWWKSQLNDHVSGWLDHHCWIKALRHPEMWHVPQEIVPFSCGALNKKSWENRKIIQSKSWMISFLWWNLWWNLWFSLRNWGSSMTNPPWPRSFIGKTKPWRWRRWRRWKKTTVVP